MIAVDTSIWIDLLRRSRPLDLVAIVDFDEIVTCLPVVLHRDRDYAALASVSSLRARAI